MVVAKSTVNEIFSYVRMRLKQALIFYTSTNPNTKRENCLI